jgi:hypothetical protein
MSFTTWPVLFEGAVSLGVGWLALGWPLVPQDAVRAIAAWGLLTGVLELVAAARLPRQSAGPWLLLTGGVFSLFLAVLIPRAAPRRGAVCRPGGRRLRSRLRRAARDGCRLASEGVVDPVSPASLRGAGPPPCPLSKRDGR